MTDLYARALNGTLRSPDSGAAAVFSIQNGLQCHLNIYLVGKDGQRAFVAPALVDGGAVPIKGACVGQYYVLTSYISDAFATVVQVTAPKQALTIDPSMLLAPGDIGPLPAPTDQIIVPQDSPRVLVGAARVSRAVGGKDPIGTCLTREQYWKRSMDSYVLAPGQTLSINYTTTTGIQDSTSKQDTIAKSLGLSAGIGWGAISAGISGSLSSTSTVLQQITLNTQNTRFDSMTVNNPTADSQMFVRWQLVDIVQVLDMNLPPWKAVVGAVVTMEAPTLVDGPYVRKHGSVSKGAAR